jgi:hypothetical protein
MLFLENVLTRYNLHEYVFIHFINFHSIERLFYSMTKYFDKWWIMVRLTWCICATFGKIKRIVLHVLFYLIPYSITSHKSEIKFQRFVRCWLETAATKRICLLRSVLETRQIGFFGSTSLKSIHFELVKKIK